MITISLRTYGTPIFPRVYNAAILQIQQIFTFHQNAPQATNRVMTPFDVRVAYLVGLESLTALVRTDVVEFGLVEETVRARLLARPEALAAQLARETLLAAYVATLDVLGAHFCKVYYWNHGQAKISSVN